MKGIGTLVIADPGERVHTHTRTAEELLDVGPLAEQEIAALRAQERHALDYAEKLTAEIRSETREQQAARQAPAQAFIDNCHRLADRAKGVRWRMHTRIAILAKQRRELILSAKEP